jgi:biopolymer transport protein ExbB/TolQ
MTIIHAFSEGGIFMYFILAFGILTISVMIERAMALYTKLKLAPETLRNDLLKSIQKGNLAEALSHAKSFSDTGLGRVAALGCELRLNGAGDEEVQSRMDEALNHEISSLDKRTGFLAMFGNVATLLGLLGTISGMIHSFAAVASANPADRATMLSKGISEAMNCTAFGLIVAIPALVAFAIYQNKTDRIVTTITESATQIFHDLLYLYEPEKRKADSKIGHFSNQQMSV